MAGRPAAADGAAPGEAVIDRALRLLAAFENRGDALSLAQLSTRAGLPKATTLRLARRLAAWGALERTGDGDYVIGLRLLEVASLSPRGHGLRSAALPFMEDLHHATGQHVLLAVRDEREAVLVERLSAHRAGQVLFRVGGRIPLHATGVGLVLLAFGPRELQEEVMAGDLPLPAERRSLSPDELRRTVARVRREGVAVASLQHPEPMSSVAAPVLDGQQTVIAALSVVAPTASLQPATIAPAVVAVARAVSRAVQRSGPRLPLTSG
ncbi:IclR family transcriptional regulator [Blastococcus xanthinilyticus]|uniref:IclR family transcriptional regulator n=1 Tax=Blastococcus xanthinilyticus TaxID=1564164 RepID=A0A5S5D378_9ACTN|nr:IclR family transcriptional regulator [Blastococcus xanthinilyticus]TYP90483.1 IclR family transcriptional regulator [Blastococcus xanthinilyticus]